VSEGAGGDDSERSAEDAAAQMDALTRDVLPALIARLSSSALGELEVRSGGWRVRLRRTPQRSTSASGGVSRATGSGRTDGGATVARSPGVGYFIPGPNLLVGQAVSRGDPLGAVDVLGIEQEVTVPKDGIIGRIHVEAGQAVEYGEALASINPDGALPGESIAAGDVAADVMESGPVLD
jgi:biotin carboxyl carrier protein